MYDNANYFAILPATVRYDERLTPRSVLLYALLTSLARADGEAYASNDYLMSVLETSERTVIRLLAQLVDEKYISVRYEYKNGTKEIARRLIRISELPLLLDLPATQALYAVIPTHILAMPRLSVQAKLLYAEISAATPTDGYCSKSAKFFAELLHSSEPTVRRLIKELQDSDALRVEMEYRDGTREILRRRLYLAAAADIVEKRGQIATDAAKDDTSSNQPNALNVANNPDFGQIRCMLNFVTTSKIDKSGMPSPERFTKKRKIQRGKRKKATVKLRL